MSTASEIIRDWLRDGLRQSGKTQSGLAAYLGVAHPQITRLIQGTRQLKLDEVQKIADYLEIVPPVIFTPPKIGGAQAEAQLKSALLAFGVDREDLSRAVSAVKIFVDDPDEPQSQDPLDDQSGSSSRRRVKAP